MNKKFSFGSVCSGIEAAQLAFTQFGYEQIWSSEIAEFPCRLLDCYYSSIPNIGDMIKLPQLILDRKYESPDLFCGGTPCQAFSLAGAKNGLNDKRGQLTMTFIEIANAIDLVRQQDKKEPAIILWENVEGVLNEKTNAFGNFIAGLAGFEDEIKVTKWTKAGFIKGKKRNIAWRVIDAKYFGLPQQRKRLYVLAGGTDFRPDQILFEFATNHDRHKNKVQKFSRLKPLETTLSLFETECKNSQTEGSDTIFYKNGVKFEFFREYTDCLYSAYGTKWNGNAAAYNGSLYVAQDNRIRRFTPLECERLMGFPDNYTLIGGSSDTNRYKAIGNSWAIPVIKWIGAQLDKYKKGKTEFHNWSEQLKPTQNSLNSDLYLVEGVLQMGISSYLNVSSIPNTLSESKLIELVETDVPEKFFLSPQACRGILRRKKEKDQKMNPALEKLLSIISEMEQVLLE